MPDNHQDKPHQHAPQQDDAPGECPGFWDAPFSSRSRTVLMVTLVACFAIQTYLVYSDPVTTRPLTAEALHGRVVWHEHNCQSCHQFFGFGGFLGPDLTNATTRIGSARLHQVLAQGSGAMPAFEDVSAEDEKALWAFLGAMNETGQGQARASTEDARTRFNRIVKAALPQDAALSEGYEITQKFSCQQCHRPFEATSEGVPDLSTSLDRMKIEEVTAVIRDGRGKMLPLGEFLSEAELEHLVAYIQWLNEERDALSTSFSSVAPAAHIDWADVPWWEFK